MAEGTVVRAEGLGFSYGKTASLRDIGLDVRAGEIFGLVGPDGAGKTTLIRVFCGLLPPETGSCRVLGFDTVRDKKPLIRRLGYLSQRFSLYGDLSVEENLAFFASIHGRKGAAAGVAGILERLDLLRFRKRLAGALSGGMKQKLALACTLIHVPDILFLDEPTNGVDPVARRDFWNILADISAGGVTIVVSTPDLAEAERFGRIAFMDAGRVVAVDTPDGARARVAGRIFEAVCDPVRRARDAARAAAGVASVHVFGDKIHAELAGGADEGPLRAALEAAVRVSSFRAVRPTLEDVFIRLLAEKRGEAA